MQGSALGLGSVRLMVRRGWRDADRGTLALFGLRAVLVAAVLLKLFVVTLDLTTLALAPAGTMPPDDLFMAERFLFTLPLTLMVTAVIWKRPSLIALCGAILAAEIVSGDHLIEHHLHEALHRWGVLALLWTGSPSGLVNPQLTVLLVYAVLIAATAVRTLRGPTLDRIFIFLAALVALGATYLFHRVIVDAALVSERGRRAAALEVYATLPDDALQGLCAKLDLECVTTANDRPFEFERIYVRDEVRRVIQEQAGAPAAATWNSSARNGGSQVFSYIVRYQPMDGGRYRVLVDHDGFAEIVDRHHVHFSMLTVSAHGIWVLGSIGLILLHRYWPRRRGRPSERTSPGLT